MDSRPQSRAALLHLVLVLAATGAAAAGGGTVTDLAWLAGSWTGEAFGGTFEEVWLAPSGGTMVGAFKLLRDGQPAMYELMVILPVEDRVELRVKHFDRDFASWEEKSEHVTFRLLEAGDGVARFDGISFTRQDDGSVVVRLRMRDSATGAVHEETLVYRPATGRHDRGARRSPAVPGPAVRPRRAPW